MTEDRTCEARFTELYDQHVEAVRRYVWRRAPLLVDDVLAETFLVAWRRLDEVPVNALPWLITVARNTLLNERRGARRQTALIARVSAETINVAAGDSGADAAEAVASDLVQSALAALPARDREVLSLSVWEDLDRDAIAAALGCSRANVSVRLHRAHRRFAAELMRLSPASRPQPRATTSAGGCDA